MMKVILSVLAVALPIGLAHGQTVSVPAATTVHAGYSPGTIGAMDEVSQGIATSPRDVAMQQNARGLSAGYSPGTVDAAPGR